MAGAASPSEQSLGTAQGGFNAAEQAAHDVAATHRFLGTVLPATALNQG